MRTLSDSLHFWRCFYKSLTIRILVICAYFACTRAKNFWWRIFKSQRGFCKRFLRFLDKLEMTCAQASFGRALDKLEMTCARVSSRACREISPCAALSRDDRAARVCPPMFSPKNLHFHLKFCTFVGKYREIWNKDRIV